ncbi:MAG: type II toxin-antitoxin system ParD family antitoxin [Ottowia sp.]|nr:type II toxin-antitoxin system ParD family antitoxin [Ottowia sp.]
MSTTTLHISLSDELKAFVESRVQAGGYEDASAYVRELLRRDEESAAEEQAAEERLKALIQEGLDSPMDPRSWEAHRAELQARLDAAYENKAESLRR